ncbi:MAG: 5-(carboxyamino)imidazole ribonucleotide synthase [Planctomycetes bacterium]|nr:5-(carboxyamino)imidazole ribonucleotide synthase [Planctomycetota bacterium]
MKVGVLGGGQLARMLALAGLPLGVRCRFLDPSPHAVAGHVGELVVAPYDDPEGLRRLADGVDVVTFEFENVPAAAIELLQQHVRVAPAPVALAIGQDRVREKTLFGELGMATPTWRAASGRDELHAAVAAVGLPCIVKTRRLGYDGKGQARLAAGADTAAIDAVWQDLGDPRNGGLIVEGFVRFDREVSVLAARARNGAVAYYPLVENVHEGGILRRSRAPAPGVPAAVAQRAHAFVRAAMERLDYVGVLAVEMFLRGDELLVNEMAPRVHNSGHWTIEGAACSQFENHLRAILGLPLGSTAMAGGGQATMVNLIGDLPERGALLELPGLHLHAYGKGLRPGRKVGHATVVGADRGAIDALAAQALLLLPGDPAAWGFDG